MWGGVVGYFYDNVYDFGVLYTMYFVLGFDRAIAFCMHIFTSPAC